MVSTDAQTYLAIDLKPAARREKPEAGWTEWVRGRKHDASVVYATGVGRGLGWPAQREVPFEEVGFEGCGLEVWGGVEGEFAGFAENAFYGWAFGAELAVCGHVGARGADEVVVGALMCPRFEGKIVTRRFEIGLNWRSQGLLGFAIGGGEAV